MSFQFVKYFCTVDVNVQFTLQITANKSFFNM